MSRRAFNCGWGIAVVLIMVVSHQVASAALVITEVQSQTTSGTDGTVNGDWWELTNSGPTSINLSGYMWADTEDDLFGADPNPNGFPNFVISPGQSIIILDEESANVPAWRTNWGLDGSVEVLSLDEMIDMPPMDAGGAFSGFGAANDAVYLYDPSGSLLSSYSWASNVRGTTFERSAGGIDLGLSVDGENGAYVAANGDIGSPGIAVPEPATVIFLLAAGAVAMFRRGR